MSTGITYNLPASAEWVLMALMLTGRIGTITQTSASGDGAEGAARSSRSADPGRRTAPPGLTLATGGIRERAPTSRVAVVPVLAKTRRLRPALRAWPMGRSTFVGSISNPMPVEGDEVSSSLILVGEAATADKGCGCKVGATQCEASKKGSGAGAMAFETR